MVRLAAVVEPEDFVQGQGFRLLPVLITQSPLVAGERGQHLLLLVLVEVIRYLALLHLLAAGVEVLLLHPPAEQTTALVGVPGVVALFLAIREPEVLGIHLLFLQAKEATEAITSLAPVMVVAAEAGLLLLALMEQQALVEMVAQEQRHLFLALL